MAREVTPKRIHSRFHLGHCSSKSRSDMRGKMKRKALLSKTKCNKWSKSSVRRFRAQNKKKILQSNNSGHSPSKVAVKSSGPSPQPETEPSSMPKVNFKPIYLSRESLVPPTLQQPQGQRKGGTLAQVRDKMDASRFRWINEQLYTSTSREAVRMFRDDPCLFGVYHRGFTAQTDKWPLNPLDSVISYVKSLPPDYRIADLGCGEGRLALSVPHRVHSFDLVSVAGHVTSCDMAHVPLPGESVEVAVFCLSLMGTNLKDYLLEAWRVLTPDGRVKIMEVTSRLESVGSFIKEVENLGFKVLARKELGKMFIDLELKKIARKGSRHLSGKALTLKPCIYKRR